MSKQISFQDLATQFSEQSLEGNWLRTNGNPNQLAVRCAIRDHNAQAKKPIKVYEVSGYDYTTTKKYLVIDTTDIKRLVKFIETPSKVIEYIVIREVEI